VVTSKENLELSLVYNALLCHYFHSLAMCTLACLAVTGMLQLQAKAHREMDCPLTVADVAGAGAALLAC